MAPVRYSQIDSAPISLLDVIPKAQHVAIRDGISSYDASANIRDGLDAISAQGRGQLFVPYGTYLCNSTIERTFAQGADIEILAEPGTVFTFPKTVQVGMRAMGQLQGNETAGIKGNASFTLSASPSAGDLTITLNDATSLSVSSLAAGDILYISANLALNFSTRELFQRSRADYVKGEFVEIQSVAGQVVTLRKGLYDSYDSTTLTDSGQGLTDEPRMLVQKVLAPRFCMRNLTIQMAGGESGAVASSTPLFTRYIRDGLLENVSAFEGSDNGIELNRWIGGSVTGGRIEVARVNGSVYYGLRQVSCQDLTIRDVDVSRSRRSCITNLGGTPYRNVHYHDCTVRNEATTSQAAFDLHGIAEHVSVNNCRIYGGFLIQGIRSGEFIGNYIENASASGFAALVVQLEDTKAEKLKFDHTTIRARNSSGKAILLTGGSTGDVRWSDGAEWIDWGSMDIISDGLGLDIVTSNDIDYQGAIDFRDAGGTDTDPSGSTTTTQIEVATATTLNVASDNGFAADDTVHIQLDAGNDTRIQTTTVVSTTSTTIVIATGLSEDIPNGAKIHKYVKPVIDLMTFGLSRALANTEAIVSILGLSGANGMDIKRIEFRGGEWRSKTRGAVDLLHVGDSLTAMGTRFVIDSRGAETTVKTQAVATDTQVEITDITGFFSARVVFITLDDGSIHYATQNATPATTSAPAGNIFFNTAIPGGRTANAGARVLQALDAFKVNDFDRYYLTACEFECTDSGGRGGWGTRLGLGFSPCVARLRDCTWINFERTRGIGMSSSGGNTYRWSIDNPLFVNCTGKVNQGLFVTDAPWPHDAATDDSADARPFLPVALAGGTDFTGGTTDVKVWKEGEYCHVRGVFDYDGSGARTDGVAISANLATEFEPAETVRVLATVTLDGGTKESRPLRIDTSSPAQIKLDSAEADQNLIHVNFSYKVTADS